ncbi:hypothetical protein SAMN05421642_11465 [Rhodococcoides kyotonense]|uniref:Uncharacterized protein n=1 Tax=Rhodococcoides kyotonense TaxID=398843 RepID=A0A239LRQ1_9NOCA|nr:hypothetical protein SAMN05421642_11465 [Rhodococcus kyotonensis]
MKNFIAAQYCAPTAGVVPAGIATEADLSRSMVRDSAHRFAVGRVAGSVAFAGMAARAEAWAAKTAIPATRLRRAHRASVIEERYREHSR